MGSTKSASKRSPADPPSKAKPKLAKTVRVKLRSGDRIADRFTVLGRPLGKGGMGTVYKVEDDGGSIYAVKRLSPALHDEKRFVTRFEREYEAASGLRHPNIIAYQELFHAEGILHIRMEYNDGVNVRQLLKKQKTLSIETATSIGRDLARALEHLHAHKVVHRDIKPENILLGRKGTVKLTDFGISRLEYSTVTRTGTLLGTPRYMSPEQLAGRKGEDISPASDLYALGIVLYEMLTGKDPYRLRKKAELLEVINVKQTREPKPLPGDIDPELSDLIMGLLQHDPAKRPESAREVGQVLGRWAVSRRQQRSVFQDLLAPAEGGTTASRKLTVSKRKRDSFWEQGQEPTSATHATQLELPPAPRYPLFPAFVATLAFFALLWGVGWWSGQGSTPAVSPPGSLRQAKSPVKAAHKVRNVQRKQTRKRRTKRRAKRAKQRRSKTRKRRWARSRRNKRKRWKRRKRRGRHKRRSYRKRRGKRARRRTRRRRRRTRRRSRHSKQKRAPKRRIQAASDWSYE
ncbi:MAG: serine/threonine protein kinase [Deltaproteobacteria bacterium]|nr:MAG: serine/threonine protein kinase [Deltaproteobacteria bacterium]